MKPLLLAVSLCSVALAQSSAPTYPDAFYALGAEYQSHNSPHFAGWLVGAKLLAPTAGTYSFSGIYVLPLAGHKISTVASTGVAQFMRKVGPVALYGIAGMGVGMSSNTTNAAVGLALNGGMLAVLPLKNGFSLMFMGQATNANGATSVVAGFGIGFGK